MAATVDVSRVFLPPRHVSMLLSVALLLVGLPHLTESSAVRPSRNESSDTQCQNLKWPREDDKANYCPFTWCVNRKGVYMSKNKTCSGPIGMSSFMKSILSLRDVDGYGCATPGRPGVPSVEPRLSPFSFRVTIVWRDPDNSTKPIGYRVALYKTHRGGSFSKYDLMESFPMHRDFTSIGGEINMVNLDTSQATDVCSPGDHCVYPTLATMRELVVNTDFRDYQVQITSLPVALMSDDAIEKQSSSNVFKMEPCESDKYKCFDILHYPLNSLSPNDGCTSPLHEHSGEKRQPVCPCELYNRFKLLDFETTNSSITVRWEWGVYADPNVRIKLTAYIDFETPWKNPVTLRAADKKTSLTIDWPGLAPGVRVSFFAQRDMTSPLQRDSLTGVVQPPPPQTVPTDQAMPATTQQQGKTVLDSTSSLLQLYTSPPAATGTRISTLTIISVTTAISLVVLLSCITLLVWRACRCTKLPAGKFTSCALLRPAKEPLSFKRKLYTMEPKPTCTVYVSYSRHTASSKHQALRVVEVLRRHGLTPIIDLEHQHEMADNVPQWVEQQMSSANYVIVLLNETYPWMLSEETKLKLLNLDSGDEFRRTKMESDLLQSEVYYGRARFVVPVFIGSHVDLEACLPASLRCKKVHRLSKDFEYGSDCTLNLLASLPASTAHDVHAVA